MLNWSRIDTVLLDMDGTLLDLHYDSHFWLEHLPQRYAQLRGLEPARARELLIRRIESLQGRLDWYCVDFWSRELELDVAALKRETRERIAWRPHSREFLARLQECGIRRVLVTNAHPVSLNLKIEQTGIDQHLDRLLTSHSFGYPKEAPQFWQGLAREEPFNPSRTLFIDDSIPVLDSARRHGIRQVLAIRAPDSQAPARPQSQHPGIHDFDEVLDALTTLARQRR